MTKSLADLEADLSAAMEDYQQKKAAADSAERDASTARNRLRALGASGEEK